VKTADFDYDLPAELIAQSPAEPRDRSRLLVLHRATSQWEHRHFTDLVEYLRPGDLLVANQTRVIPARLFGRKESSPGGQVGGKVEFLLLNRRNDRVWEVLVRGKGLRPGRLVRIQAPTGAPLGDSIHAVIEEVTPSGSRLVRFDPPVDEWLWDVGQVPLPPYIHQPLTDAERYQTVYSRVEGSAAAPTAGLHFTPELLVVLREIGIDLAYVTLHIGLDTFQPVREDEVESHQIHREWCELSPEVARQVNHARLAGRRIIAVGTTVVRVLESAAGGCAPGTFSEGDPSLRTRGLFPSASRERGTRLAGGACAWHTVQAFTGSTDLFIYPGYRFRVIDAMITNFHLPRSTLLMLVSAFAGRDLILQAYEEAMRERYRFYSFGDAMLIL
jgi:S-adenosylmethionine:tRNA ribosyltransferase-isomerase